MRRRGCTSPIPTPACTFCNLRGRERAGRLHHIDSGTSPYQSTPLRAAQAAIGEGWGMAQTIEAFVGNALDEAKISPLHRRVIGLIAAGYFCDVIYLHILRTLILF